jgi:cyanate permease
VAQAKREARAALNWPLVIFALLASGAIFLGCLSAPDHTLSWWALVIGSGAMIVAYLWIAFQKLRDRQD